MISKVESNTLRRHRAYLDGDADRPDASCHWPRRTGVRRWCIVQSEYRREKTAEDEIKGAGYLVYVPRFKTRVRDRSERKWIDAERPLLPGYLFVDCADEPVPAVWLACRRGVRDVLRQGDQVVLVPDRVIEQLRCDQGINFGQPYRSTGPALPLAVDDQVRITDGPFTGFYGLVGHIDVADRITVFIELFGGVNPVRNLTIDQLSRRP